MEVVEEEGEARDAGAVVEVVEAEVAAVMRNQKRRPPPRARRTWARKGKGL